MIKNAIQKYFSILRYYFIPLVILFLFIFIGIIAIYQGVITKIGDLSDIIGEVEGATNEASDLFKESLIIQVKSLVRSDNRKFVNTMFDSEAIATMIKAASSQALGTIEGYETEIESAIVSAAEAIAYGVVLILIELSGGILIGFYITKWIARRKLIKRTLTQTLKSFALGFPFLTLELVLIGLCIRYLYHYVVLYLILSLIIYSFASLTKAYLIQKKKDTRFKTIVNTNNIFKLYLADLIVLLLALGFSFIMLFIFRNVIGILLAIPFIELAMIEISLMSENYVSDKINS